MIIENISLTNFRNYGRLDMEVGPSVNVIYGNNAQGKTNIIEAVNVGSSVTSHRTSKDREMIKFGEREYIVSLKCRDEVYSSDNLFSVAFYDEKSEFNSRPAARRVLMQNGIEIPRISGYIGACNTVIFAPEDLNLVKGAPVFRRKYLNLLISKVSPSYYDLLGRAKRIIEQKNTCLKSFRGRFDASNKADVDMKLDYWDFSLAELSAELIIYRYRYCLLISRKAAAHHSVISDGKESLSVKYCSVTGSEGVFERFLNSDVLTLQFIDGTISDDILARIKESLTDFLLEKLRNARSYDVEKGVSSVGVHRDDIEILLSGLPMRQFSSQGQQRSASLSLKLTELEIIRERTRSSPILLLDDVFSELDEGRRISLLSGVGSSQIFITCTDRSFVENQFSGLVRSDIETSFFRVENGVVYHG